MERVEKLVEILKLTPHRQPELVKEASNRILSRSIKNDIRVSSLIKPFIQILIQYCDTDDSSQRSLFNDYLNSIILCYQHLNYQQILDVLIDVTTANGSARSVTAALQRMPLLIDNVRPIELGCDASRLVKTLIEVSRRSDDESVIMALDFTLKSVTSFLDYYVRKSKEMQILCSSLIEVLLRNLQTDASQVRRITASSLSTLCKHSDSLRQIILTRLENQLKSIADPQETSVYKFVGFCLCVREVPQFAVNNYETIIGAILDRIKLKPGDIPLETTALETLKDLLRFDYDPKKIQYCAKLIAKNYLLVESEGKRIIKADTKVILQANALACISAIVKQKPSILDQLESLFLFKDHNDTAIRGQLLIIIGNYIGSTWKFPYCVDQSIDCEKIRKLWIVLRTVLTNDKSNPDTLKSSIIAIRSCINTLLESDHCLHIIEYNDFNNIIQLYLNSNFKPFKIEVLNLFAVINYKTLSYLERSHWWRMMPQAAGAFTKSLQETIVTDIIIPSIVDEHQRVRSAAISTIVAIIPNLYITNLNVGQRSAFRSNDPIVALARDLADEHLVVVRQADEHINHFNNSNGDFVGSEQHESLCIRNDHKSLTSSIIQSFENPYNEQFQTQLDVTKSQHRVNVTLNLAYVVGLLKSFLEDGLKRGKTAISSIVHSLHEITIQYPVYQYSASWDCRPSEYCECFTLLNFLLAYMENLTEPDVVVDDLEAYKNFLALAQHLLYSLCHESVLNDYEHQKLRPFHKRQSSSREGYWSELKLKHPCIADVLDVYFTHLTKLLWLITCIIDERNNPFSMSSKRTPMHQQKSLLPENLLVHGSLVSNQVLFARLHKKLESSFKSGKKNLNQHDQKFPQIIELCLTNISSLLEFVGMSKSMEIVKDLLGYLSITSPISSTPSLICARQLLKSLFGINILALYQLDPDDWFVEESWSAPSNEPSLLQDNSSTATTQGVYHHLVANPYKIFSSYHSINCSQITPTNDEALAVLNYESRRALKVRRRIENRVKSLFEYNPNQLVSIKTRQISELLKNTITEFTPTVTECMNQFNKRCFSQYQSEILHFMSYLVLLRVNYQKLATAGEFLDSVNSLLDKCGERIFLHRDVDMDTFLRNSFTFLTLLSYERGPSKPMFQIATVIQKFDDIRAKLSMTAASEKVVNMYVVPLLRCLVEDLFIYRTKRFQDVTTRKEVEMGGDAASYELTELSKKDMFEIFEAERETVAQKLLDVIDNPRVYDLLSILMVESRHDSGEIKYKKLSQHLLSIIPTMLTKRDANLMDYRSIELMTNIIENISPEVFQPVNFIFETLLGAPKPPSSDSHEFLRWMSLVIIAIHILITQVKEDVFLARLRATMSEEAFVNYLLQIAQLCMAELILRLYSPVCQSKDPSTVFLTQQLSSYILYLTYMFQSGLFFHLLGSAEVLMKKEIESSSKVTKPFRELCKWARDSDNSFSLNACERMFYNIRLVYPDLTISWCNLMTLLNNVNCNRDFWSNLLIYECHHCQSSESLNRRIEAISLDSSSEDLGPKGETSTSDGCSKFKRGATVSRPASLNLSDISFSDQLRRSFIKRMATAETRDKALNRNIISTSNEDGQLLEREVSIGNTEQCLAPNIELTRRGALCLVLDFVTISMNDVEHITWLIIHHINDIIRWSNEVPIAEFVNTIHGKSASSGIYIQSVNNGFNDLTSITLVTRLLGTLEKVHYTQYGSLLVLLIEKLLSSEEIVPYRSLTRNIEEFACLTVKKLLNETNKNLVTTNDEVLNQLAAQDLDRLYSLLDVDLYSKLAELLIELRESTTGESDNPMIKMHDPIESSSDESEINASVRVTVDKVIPSSIHSEEDDYNSINHDTLAKDHSLLDNFCNRLLSQGWSSRRQFEEAWMILLGVLSTTLSPVQLSSTENLSFAAQEIERKSNLLASCKTITAVTKLLLMTRRTCSLELTSCDQAQGFDEKVSDLAKAIGSNLSSLRKKTQSIFESMELERRSERASRNQSLIDPDIRDTGFTEYLRMSAQKLRMSSILNVEVEMHDATSIEEKKNDDSKERDVDVDSCIRLLLSIYKQKLEDPNESLCSPSPMREPNSAQKQQSNANQKSNQLAPPLVTAICHSILALSNLFTDFEHFEWMFESFVQMFKVAERNEDEIQMQYLILGLCKSASVCCYEIPSEISTNATMNHKDTMFEKCRQSIDKCIKSDFGPLKLNALFGIYYMLEDSINIVASGAWELDHFKQLRLSRLTWIVKLMPLILDRENAKLLTKKASTMRLLETVCLVVTESETQKSGKA